MALDDLVSALADDLAALVAETARLGEASDEEVCEMVAALPAMSDLFGAVMTETIGEWDSRGLFRLDGSRAAGARLARDAGWSKTGADHVVTRARRLRHHRQVAEAYRNGDLSTDKTDVLCKAAIPARRALFAEAETNMVSDAKRLSCDDLKGTVAYWADAADDDLGRDRSKRQHEGRRLSCSRTYGRAVAIDGLLDPVAGTVVMDELKRLTQQLFEDDWAMARNQYGPLATTQNLPRTATQRRADALVIMATRSATMPADGRTPRPLFTAMTDKNTLLKICQMADGTVIAPQLLASWLTQADIERVIFDTPARVIEVGVKKRFFTGGIRRAIELRDKHCTFPGCTVPANRCDIDHIIEYSQGGPTTQANGRLRCPAHNRQRPGRNTPPPQGP
ncbi:MAG: hypothetical protein ABI239_10155 [Aquihabitans sp.]